MLPLVGGSAAIHRWRSCMRQAAVLHAVAGGAEGWSLVLQAAGRRSCMRWEVVLRATERWRYWLHALAGGATMRPAAQSCKRLWWSCKGSTEELHAFSGGAACVRRRSCKWPAKLLRRHLWRRLLRQPSPVASSPVTSSLAASSPAMGGAHVVRNSRCVCEGFFFWLSLCFRACVSGPG